jgi:phospholipase/carboxylesterase
MIPDPQLVENGPLYEQAGLAHRIVRPSGNGPHPTVVMLHGYLGNEDVMWIFANAIPKHWLKIAPRGQERLADGGYSWSQLPQTGQPDLDSFAEAVTAVTKFIHSLPELYQADPEQIYLMGFSQGAATAWAVAAAHPQLAQGIAGLVGFMPALPADNPFPADHWQGLPIFMAAGQTDDTIPLTVARQSADVARQLGATVDYREYETGHKLNAAGMRDLREWWQSRL